MRNAVENEVGRRGLFQANITACAPLMQISCKGHEHFCRQRFHDAKFCITSRPEVCTTVIPNRALAHNLTEQP
jgi:hypothetical protein